MNELIQDQYEILLFSLLLELTKKIESHYPEHYPESFTTERKKMAASTALKDQEQEGGTNITYLAKAEPFWGPHTHLRHQHHECLYKIGDDEVATTRYDIYCNVTLIHAASIPVAQVFNFYSVFATENFEESCGVNLELHHPRTVVRISRHIIVRKPSKFTLMLLTIFSQEVGHVSDFFRAEVAF